MTPPALYLSSAARFVAIITFLSTLLGEKRWEGQRKREGKRREVKGRERKGEGCGEKGYMGAKER